MICAMVKPVTVGVGDGRPPIFNDGILIYLISWGPIDPYGIGLMSLSPMEIMGVDRPDRTYENDQLLSASQFYLSELSENKLHPPRLDLTTLPETNMFAPARLRHPKKETIIFQASIFRCETSLFQGGYKSYYSVFTKPPCGHFQK